MALRVQNKPQPDFDIDFTRGKVGEDLVETFLSDLVGKKIEVKTDYRAKETGNVYVETWQYSRSDKLDKRQSGINVSKAEYYCFASPTGQGFIMIKTETLKQVIREEQPKIVNQPINTGRTNASEGRLVKVTSILRKLQLLPKER